MGLSGNLEDVSIVDMLQIFGLAGRTGVLVIERSSKRAEIGFVEGRINMASMEPRTVYMTDVLVRMGRINRETLLHALRLQQRPEYQGRSIGSVLLELGMVERADVELALRQHIQIVINEVATWSDGEFSFQPGGRKPVDDLHFCPDDLGHELSLNPQELLLEAIRLADEDRLRAEQAGPEPEPPSAQEEADPADDRALAELTTRRVVITLTSDVLLRHTLKQALVQRDVVFFMPSTLDEVRRLVETIDWPPPVLVVDTDLQTARLSSEQPGLEAVEQLRREWPGAPLISFGRTTDLDVVRRVTDAGVTFHAPRPAPEASGAAREQTVALAAVLEQIVARTLASGSELGPTFAEMESCVAGMRSLYDEVVALRRNAHSATVSLEVMGHISRFLERAVLLLVRRGSLHAIGMFGVDRAALEAAGGIQSVRLTIDPQSVIQAVIDGKQGAFAVDPGADPTLSQLCASLGAPFHPSALVLPLVIADQVISIVYADNGSRQAPLCPGEFIGVLVEYAGLCMENVLLRRNLKQRRAGTSPSVAGGESPVTAGCSAERRVS